MKYRYLSIFLLILIFSVGAVCAHDNSTDESSVIAASSDDVVSIDSNIDVLQDNESDEFKSFSIDDSNFNSYFDENGTILESANISDYSEIILGNISNHVMVFDKILTIIPNNDSVLTNVGITFNAGSDNSIIKGLTFQNTNGVAALTIFNASDILILDNVFSVSSGDADGLIAISADYAKNLLFSSNNVTYSAKSNGTAGKYANAIRITNSDNANIYDNRFRINVSSVDVSWNEIPAASGNWVSDSISEGIVVKDSNNVTISLNMVFLNATDIVTAYGYDTVYVVDINNCTDSYFGSNYVVAQGQDYIYGLIASGDNLNITTNSIIVQSLLNYANGIDIEGPADVTVENNLIAAIAPEVAYAVYSAMSNGNVTAKFNNNTINAKAYAAFGMELGGTVTYVGNNNITVLGNHTTGIASNAADLTIVENNINITGSGVGNKYVWDSFGVDNVAILSKNNNVCIKDNNITAKENGIKLSDSNVTIEGNDVVVEDTGLDDSYAISVSDSTNVVINNNTVDFTGKTNGTFGNAALSVDGSSVKSIDENTFNIAIPSVDVEWPEIPAGSGNYVRVPVSEGIVLKNDTNLVFSTNNVILNATDVVTAWGYDTIYVVDVDSDDAVVDNNIIVADGADYVYGIIISGDNFTVSNNAIQVESNNYANGIDVEGPAEGIVDSNVIALTSPTVAYGIYAAMSNGNVSVDYTNNTIRADSYAAFGMELGGIETNVGYNTIELNGNYTTGIAANLDSLIINDNEIIVNGSGVGNEYVWDGFGVDNVAIKAINGNVAISYNNITSTGKGLFITKSNLTAERNTITVNDNGLADSYGIYVFDSSDVLIINNGINFTGNTNGTFVNNALYVADSDVDAIEENTFDIAIPSVDVEWPEIPAGSGNYVRVPVSEGIVLKNDTNLVFSTNNVILNATDVVTAWGYDTIYVVDVDSDDAVIDNNIIVANGADYVYGIIVSGSNFTVCDNVIQAESDYYTNGIDVEGPADGIVVNNVIALSSPTAAYGIYAAMSNGNVTVGYSNNTIRAESYAAFGMELGGINASVSDNVIELIGNYTTGIAARVTNLGVIGNNITVSGSGKGDMYFWDSFGVDNVAIKIVGGLTIIENNTIDAAVNGIVVSGANLTIVGNDVVVEDIGLDDSYAISVSECADVKIAENTIDYTGKTNSTFVNNALYVADSDVDAIEENTFDIAIPSVDVNWREIPATSGNWVSAPVSEGIVLDNVTDLAFSDNIINLNGTDIITAAGYDTIYVIDVKADNAVIDANTITAMGKDYIYGIIIKGKDFTISNNLIDVESDSTYADGIDIEPVSSGVVDNNKITVKAPEVVYGIYTAMDWYDYEYSDAIDYTNNLIDAESNAVYAMSLYGSEANIADNTLVLDGNYTMGIVSMMMDDVTTITGNDITANGLKDDTAKTGDMVDAQTVGIFTMSESQVHNNIITSAGNYTVVNSASDSEITYNYLVSKELLGDESVRDTLNDSLVENNIPVANATNYNLTNDTFYLFFDENGILRNNITSESLTFIGEFSEVGPWIGIDRPIKLLSDNATLNDIAFIINSDNVTIDGFNFISENMSNLIEIFNADNVSVINNNFDVTGVEDDDNAVIRLIQSDNVVIDNNKIDFAVETNDTISNNIISSEYSDNVVVTNNNITADIPARPINWTSGQVLSDVMSFINSDNVRLEDNNILISSNDQTSPYDTVYGVHITGENATIINNEIELTDAPYGYGIVVAGKDFTIGDNNITVGQDKDYACAIDIESNSNGNITDNNINVAGVSSYGIYTANWGGDVQTDIVGNNINASGNSVFGLSLSGSEAIVENNNITTTGNFTTGVACDVDIISIANNTIVADASNEGTPLGYDTMGIETTGVHIVGGCAIVENNNITTTGEYAVDAMGTGSVTDNYLISANFTGDASVNYIADDTFVYNNTPTQYKIFLSTEDVVMYYKNGTRFVVKVLDGQGNPLANESVSITINGIVYNRTTNENGTTSIAINLNPGNYTVPVSYIGSGNCSNATVENTITVLSTIYGNDLVKMFRNESQYYATFLDGQGNPLASGTMVRFNINGVMYDRRVNENGTAKLNINLRQGTYVLTAYHPNGEMHSNNITVLSTIVSTDLVKYYRNGSQYVVTILGADGKAVGAGVNVTFNINGVMYTRQTNASGQAKLNINLGPGNYTITAIYKECMVSNNIEVLPVLFADDLVKKYGTSDQFRALLLDGQGKPFFNQTITFNINGVFYTRLTNADGYATLNIRLGAAKDTYIITSSYNGTSISNKIYIVD